MPKRTRVSVSEGEGDNNASEEVEEVDGGPSAAPAGASLQHKAPRLHHCFLAGDLVEAMYSAGCWVPGQVLQTRSRQVLVLYEKEAAELTGPAVKGPRHICRENETPREVAKKAGVPVAVLLQLNAERFPELSSTSRMRAQTILTLPEIYVCGENETPKQIAKRFGRDLEQLVEDNQSTVHGLEKTSKLRRNTVLALPPAAGDEAACALPPQLGEIVEVASPVPSEPAEMTQAGAWHAAEVVRLAAGSRFTVQLREAERRTEDDGARAAAADDTSVDANAERQIEDLDLGGEGTAWRRTADRSRAGGAAAEPVAVGAEVHVEVSDEEAGEGRVRWRPAEVRALLDGGRFTVCVDGDEDFVEE